MKEDSFKTLFPDDDTISDDIDDVPWRKKPSNLSAASSHKSKSQKDTRYSSSLDFGSSRYRGSDWETRNSLAYVHSFSSQKGQDRYSAELLDENYPLNAIEKPISKPILRLSSDKNEERYRDDRLEAAKINQNEPSSDPFISQRFGLENTQTLNTTNHIPVLNRQTISNSNLSANSLFSNPPPNFSAPYSQQQELPAYSSLQVFSIPPPTNASLPPTNIYQDSAHNFGNPSVWDSQFIPSASSNWAPLPSSAIPQSTPDLFSPAINSQGSEKAAVDGDYQKREEGGKPSRFSPGGDSAKPREDEAVRNEMRQQNLSLMSQRNSYLKKYDFLNEELDKLKKQKADLVGKKRDQHVEHVLKCNEELQIDIQSKMKGVKNVIEMLSKIIKEDEPKKSEDGKSEPSSERKVRDEKREGRDRRLERRRSRSRSKSRSRKSRRSVSRSRSRSRHRRRSRSKDKESVPKTFKDSEKNNREKTRAVETIRELIDKELSGRVKKGAEVESSKLNQEKTAQIRDGSRNSKNGDNNSVREMENKPAAADTIVHKVYYDPEIHWCQFCDVFPKTAKEYLLHLHEKKHKDEIAKRNVNEYPWHKSNTVEIQKRDPNAPTERTPIRGLPFFISATAWYCKLCCAWMGDMHCASAHLKSTEHENKYKEFVGMNPLWEETWLQNRSKALELYSRLQMNESVFSCAMPPSRLTLPAPHEDAKAYLHHVRTLNKKGDTSNGSSSTASSSNYSIKDSLRKEKAKKSSHLMKNDSPLGDKKKERSQSRSPRRKDEDKFVKEWSKTVHGGSREKEFVDLRKKLKRDAEEKAKVANMCKQSESGCDSSSSSRWSHSSSAKDESKRKSNNLDKMKSDTDVPQPRLVQPIKLNKPQPKFSLPIIGKMPFSKAAKKKEEEKEKQLDDSKKSKDALSDIPLSNDFSTAIKPTSSQKHPLTLEKDMKISSDDSKVLTDKKGQETAGVQIRKRPIRFDSDQMSATIKKHLEEYEKQLVTNTTVIDMDIELPPETDGFPHAVINDSNCRKQDFDATLRLLFPEDNSSSQSPAATSTHQYNWPATNINQFQQSSHQSQNVTPEHLIQLIQSAMAETMKAGYSIHNPVQFAERIRQNVMVNLYQDPQQQQQTMLQIQNLLAAAANQPFQFFNQASTSLFNGLPFMTSNEPPVPGVDPEPLLFIPQVVQELAKSFRLKEEPAVDSHAGPAKVETELVKQEMKIQLVAVKPESEVTQESKSEVKLESKNELFTQQKKKKNPMSQKKRRHLALQRKKLEEQELELKAKMEKAEKMLEEARIQAIQVRLNETENLLEEARMQGRQSTVTSQPQIPGEKMQIVTPIVKSVPIVDIRAEVTQEKNILVEALPKKKYMTAACPDNIAAVNAPPKMNAAVMNLQSKQASEVTQIEYKNTERSTVSPDYEKTKEIPNLFTAIPIKIEVVKSLIGIKNPLNKRGCPSGDHYEDLNAKKPQFPPDKQDTTEFKKHTERITRLKTETERTVFSCEELLKNNQEEIDKAITENMISENLHTDQKCRVESKVILEKVSHGDSGDVNVTEIQEIPFVKMMVDNDLMMLGIDEDDSAAINF